MKAQEIKQNVYLNLLYQQLLCPITHDLMVDPVLIETGHTFDRKSIQNWFHRGHKNNPLTGLPLKSLTLYPNICVKNILLKLPLVNLKISEKLKNYEQIFQSLQSQLGLLPAIAKGSPKNFGVNILAENASLKNEIEKKNQQELIKRYEHQIQIEKLRDRNRSLLQANRRVSIKYLQQQMKQIQLRKRYKNQSLKKYNSKQQCNENREINQKLQQIVVHKLDNGRSKNNEDKLKSKKKSRPGSSSKRSSQTIININSNIQNVMSQMKAICNKSILKQ